MPKVMVEVEEGKRAWAMAMSEQGKPVWCANFTAAWMPHDPAKTGWSNGWSLFTEEDQRIIKKEVAFVEPLFSELMWNRPPDRENFTGNSPGYSNACWEQGLKRVSIHFWPDKHFAFKWVSSGDRTKPPAWTGEPESIETAEQRLAIWQWLETKE